MMTIDMFDVTAPTADVTIVPITPADVDDAIGVLARGMRDNPLHVAAFGSDSAARGNALRKMFRLMAKRPDLIANARVARTADGAIVGVYSAAAPGNCQPNSLQRILMMPVLLTLGVGNARRVVRWLSTWGAHDPGTPHWHFGPIAVEASLQGQGVGSAMMRDFCARMDAGGGVAYLETDKQINVRFHERFGFEVIATDDVLGVPNWFMIRQPSSM